MPVGQNFLEQLRKVKVSKKIITRSIRDLIADFQSAKIVIPPYQRTFVWEHDKQCRFIESVFMDIPIPPLFLLEKFDEEKETTIFEIIDGVQRLTTLFNFINGILKLSKLENLPDLNQSTFQSLPSNIAGLFSERQLSTIIIESDTHPEIQFEVFGRLNMGSVSLNAQELRNCMFHGDFNDFLIDCSKHPIYRQLLDPFPKLKPPKEGKPDKNRMFDIELILRFFALHDFYKKDINQYRESKGETLNEYMRKQIEGNENLSSKEKLEQLLDKVLEMIRITFKGNQFKSFSINTSKGKAGFSTQVNAAVFDIQMLGFVDYEINDIEDKADVIYDAFMDLSSYNRDFIDATTRSTNSKVNERLGIWKQRLNLIIENFEDFNQEFRLKKQAFTSHPFCNSTKEEILEIEQADFYEGKLYHKCYSPRTDYGKIGKSTRATVNTEVTLKISDEKLLFANLKELVDFIIDYLDDNISDDEHDLERLESLEFIGDQERLLSRIKGDKKIRKLGGLKNKYGKSLYINITGGRNEIIENITEILSLFSFAKDTKVIRDSIND